MKIEGDYLSDSSDGPQATPISPGLEPIMEESDEDMVTSSEPNMHRKKKGKKGKKKRGMVPMMPVVLVNPYMNVAPGQMPTFHPGKNGQVPYQLAFAPMPVARTQSSTPTKRKKNVKGHTVSFNSQVGVSPEPSTTALSQSNKMMTFSNLRQVMNPKQHKRSKSVEAVPAGGSFTGHASMDVSTITKNSNVVKKGIMKKSSSDSSGVGQT